MTFKRKIIGSLFWTFLERFSLQTTNFILSIILARLVMPEEFGMIGMISVVIAVGVTLRDSGLTSSLIRTSTPDETDYSTVFFMNLGSSLLIYSIIFLSSPFIASFFDRPELSLILRLLSIKIIIGAFSSIQSTRLTKEMNFKRQLWIHVPSIALGGVAGVVFAWMGYGVWSLVYMNLIQEVLAMVLFWVLSDWRPRWIFSKEKFSVHYSFGYKLMLSGLLNTIYDNLYNIIIGKFFSAAQLGYYTRAQSLKQLPVNNISAALNRVTYPMFAELQHDNTRLKNVYKRLMQQVLYWIAPLLIGAGVLAEPLFRFLFTEKWLPAVPYFQVLCVTGIMYPLHAYNLNILNVKGRSDLFLKLEIIKRIYVTIGIFIAIPFGIMGLLWFQAISTFLVFFINTHYSGKLIQYPVWEQIKDLAPVLVLSVCMGLFCFASDAIFTYFFTGDLLRIASVSVLSMLFYIGVSHVSKLSPYLEFKQLAFKV